MAQTYKRHKLYCRKIGNLNFLFIELPSGRAIAYPGAHLVYGEHNGKPTAAIGFMEQWAISRNPKAPKQMRRSRV